MNLRTLRSTPVLAIAAVVVIVGLAAPAAGREVSHLINGASIKKHSVSGNRLKNNTLTGAQIKESTLGKVPSASKAGSAPLPSTLGSGDTMTGAWAFPPAKGPTAIATISFPVTVPGSITPHVIDTTTSPPGLVPSGCTGTPTAPGAKPGNLCIFLAFDQNAGVGAPYGVINPATGDEASVSSHGVIVFGTVTTSDRYATGTWAVTAP